jgi:hypothetical protein
VIGKTKSLFLQNLNNRRKKEMNASSSQGIAGKASKFKGVVRPSFIKIVLLDKDNVAIPDVICEVTFVEGGEKEEAKSDSKGIVKFKKKTSWNFVVKSL